VIRALGFSAASAAGAAMAAMNPVGEGLLAFVVVALLLMLAGVVFSGSNGPTNHLVAVIEAIRGSRRPRR
jgi:hypothetical protein